MQAGEPLMVAFAVQGEVLTVHPCHLGHAVINYEVISPRLSGFFEGEVSVAAGSVPISLDGLGVIVSIAAVKLGHTSHDVPGQPHMVTALYTFSDAHLVLPLRRGHFPVDARDM